MLIFTYNIMDKTTYISYMYDEAIRAERRSQRSQFYDCILSKSIPDSIGLICVSFLAAQTESSPGLAAFLDSVQDLCKQSRNDWYRVYLIRKICGLNGVEYVQKLLHEDQLSWLFPQEVLQMVGFNLVLK